MKMNEIADDVLDDSIISAKKCKSNIPDHKLGASNLASCKSRGLRSRDGGKTYKKGKKTVPVKGKRIKGKKYGGPLPDYS